jgi:hypothetical protein
MFTYPILLEVIALTVLGLQIIKLFIVCMYLLFSDISSILGPFFPDKYKSDLTGNVDLNSERGNIDVRTNDVILAFKFLN